MLLRELFEARKNPEQNPKVSINQVIAQMRNQPNTFISFTEVDKLGINPNSTHGTPIGIYAYPIQYAFKMMGAKKTGKVLPYAGDAEFANIFQARGNIVDLGTITEDQAAEYISDIIDYVSDMDPSITRVISKATRTAMLKAVRSVGGRFWYVTKVAAEQIADEIGSDVVVAWNKLFRAIGIDGCVDSKGEGIIHENEPTQAVFFSIRAIGGIQRVYNRYSPNAVQPRIKQGQQMHKAAIEIKQAKSLQ